MQRNGLKSWNDLTGGTAAPFAADVSTDTGALQIFEAIDKTFGNTTALVNNAGILETQMRVEEMDINRLWRILNNNIVSCFLCSKEAIKRMSTKNGGEGGAFVNTQASQSRGQR